MPNDCWNHITILCDPENPIGHDEIHTFINDELHTIYINDDIYDDRISVHKKHHSYILFTLCSKWYPDFEWLEGLLDKYPSCWIKNEWYEESGQAGVWIGCIKNDEKHIQNFHWEDIHINHPVFSESD